MGDLTGVAAALLALWAEPPYLFSFGLLLIEEAGVPLPLPGDVLALYAGAAGPRLGIDPFRWIGLAVLSSVLGSSALYAVARRWGAAALDRSVDRFGHLVGLRPEHLVQARARARRGAMRAVFLGRLAPGMRIVTSLVAGSLHVPWRSFIVANLASAVLWWSVAYAAGAVLGPPVIRTLAHLPVWSAVLGLAPAIIVAFVVRHRARAR